MFDLDELEEREGFVDEVSAHAATSGSEAVLERCARERKRPPISWEAAGLVASSAERGGYAAGLLYGITFPWSDVELTRQGPAWLTKAFHVAGTLAKDNKVVAVQGLHWLGSAGGATRLLLEVQYLADGPELHSRLAVKIPRLDSSQAAKLSSASAASSGFWRLRTASEGVEPPGPYPSQQNADYFAEINFYRLYEDESPLRMPKFYYGDISHETGNFILITEMAPRPLMDDQQCYLRGPHGGYLTCFPDDGNNQKKKAPLDAEAKRLRRQGVYMFPQPSSLGMWTLKPADGEGCRVFIEAPTTVPKFLSTFNDKEQAFYLSLNRGPWEKWTLVPVSGEPEFYFLRCAHGTHLASLDDEGQSLYMSPKAEAWEKWRCLSFESAIGTVSEHLDIRGASLDVCEHLVSAGAELAGKHKAGLLGDSHFVSRSFGRTAVPAEKMWEPDATWRGLGDTEFIARAAQAQEFITRVGAALFADIVTPATMKGYRAMLVTTRANLHHIRWWCNAHEDYVALGHDRLDMDSAFRWQERGGSSTGLGLRDWEGVSIGPLGAKLWGLLRFAESDVLVKHRDALLQRFIRVYHRAGGCGLDLENLRMHFTLSAALESVQLLDSVPEIYRCWPKDLWTSIKGLRDPRLGQGALWLCLKSLVNIALVLSTSDVVELLYQVMPLIFYDAVHVAMPSRAFLVKSLCAEVRSEPRVTAALASCFAKGFRLLGTGRRRHDDGQQEFLEVTSPVYGWVDVSCLEPTDLQGKDMDPQISATSDIFERMFHTRRQYTGATPLGMSTISTLKLCETLQKYDTMFHCLRQFGHGQCRVVTGGFRAERDARPWWPRGYEDWAQHTFLVFEDGTIADITADQFDDVPQLWWPADGQRYTFDPSKADNAELVRAKVGLKRWSELVARDKKMNPSKKRYEWWVAQSYEADGVVQLNRRGSLPNRAVPRALRLRGVEGEQAVVLRDSELVELPPVSRHLELGEGRPMATFRRLSEEHELEVWLVEQIFTTEELEQLVRLCEARGGFQPSLQNNTSGLQVQDGLRTSHSCTLHSPLLWGCCLEELQHRGDLDQEVEEELVAAQHVTDLCARVLEVDAAFVEPLQLVKYTPGQFYRAHMDTHKEPDRLSSHNGEQRTHTLLVFMTSVPEKDGGGYLHFPRLGLRVLPRAGCAVLWNNLREASGKPNPESLHEGEAPLKSEKIAMNVWKVDRPFTAQTVAEGRLRRQRLAEAAVVAPERAAGQPLLVCRLRELERNPEQLDVNGDGHGKDAASTISGQWEDEEKEVMSIESSKLTGPDGTSFPILRRSADACSIQLAGECWEGKLSVSGSMSWSDGSVWLRKSAHQQ